MNNFSVESANVSFNILGEEARKVLVPSIIGVSIALLIIAVNVFVLFLILRNEDLRKKVPSKLTVVSCNSHFSDIQLMGISSHFF